MGVRRNLRPVEELFFPSRSGLSINAEEYSRMIKKNIFRFSFHSFVTRTHTLSYFHTYLHENETTIYLCNTRTDLEREKLYRHAYTSGGRIIFSRSERSPSSRVTREMARRSAAIEKKKKLKDQRGKRGAVSRDIDVATPLPLPSAVGFSKLSLSNVRGAFCSDREEENEKKNWRENRVQKIYFPLSLSLSLSLIENSTDFVTCKSENCFQHLLSYSF